MTRWTYGHLPPREWILQTDDSRGYPVDRGIVIDGRGVRGRARDAHPIWGGEASTTPQPIASFADHGPSDDLGAYGSADEIARIRAWVLLARKDEQGENDLRASLETIARALADIGDANEAASQGSLDEADRQRAEATATIREERDGPLAPLLARVLPELYDGESFGASWRALRDAIESRLDDAADAWHGGAMPGAGGATRDEGRRQT